MKVYCVQYDVSWEARGANHERVERFFSGGSFERGALVLLPEMFDAGFGFNLSVIAEGAERESSVFLRRMAVEHGVWVMGGVVRMNGGGRGLNQAVVYSPEGIEVCCYTKQRPFVPGGEGEVFDCGVGPSMFEWGGVRVSPFICYDLRFPELQRIAALAFVPELMTFVASWPEARIAHWVKLLQARAIENQCYVAGVNRIGSDPKLVHVGRSLIVSPMGEVVADAEGGECVIGAELDLSALRAYREGLPFLRDARPVTMC